MAAGALAFAILAAACTGTEGTTTTLTDTTAGAALEPIETERLLDEIELESLASLVAGLRGLEFIRPIRVEIVDRDAFVARTNEILDEPGGSPDSTWLRLIGALPGDNDLSLATARLLASSVAILDAANDRVLVRADAGTGPFVESVVVHEMVHALHFQHFGLDPAPAPAANEESYVARALAEGDARRITQRFLRSLSQRDRGRYEAGRLGAAEDATAIRASTPQFVLDLLTLPTDDGLRFVQIADDATVDDYLTNTAAVTSEELIIAGADVEPVPVDLPPIEIEGYEPSIDGSGLGVGNLRLLLRTVLNDDQLGAALVGWGGDTVEVRRRDDDVVFAYRYRGEREEDAQELAAGFRLLLDLRLTDGAYASVRVLDDSVLVLMASDPSVSDQLDRLYSELGEEVFLVQLG